MRGQREVELFAQAMLAKLAQNYYKGGWQGLDRSLLFTMLMVEVDELHRAISYKLGPEDILSEAADVANYAMMIADVCGALKDGGMNRNAGS